MDNNNIEELEELEVPDLETQDDGTQIEVYRDKRTGNIVTPPRLRSPNGSVKDPREQVCWDLYIKSWKAGMPNAAEAARIAGYAPNTCLNITGQRWFKKRKDKLRRSKMMENAERNIARILNMGYTEIKKLEDGTDKEVVDKDILKVVADMSKTIVTTLGKDLGYSAKAELRVSAAPTPILKLNTIDITPQLSETNEPVVE